MKKKVKKEKKQVIEIHIYVHQNGVWTTPQYPMPQYPITTPNTLPPYKVGDFPVTYC